MKHLPPPTDEETMSIPVFSRLIYCLTGKLDQKFYPTDDEINTINKEYIDLFCSSYNLVLQHLSKKNQIKYQINNISNINDYLLQFKENLFIRGTIVYIYKYFEGNPINGDDLTSFKTKEFINNFDNLNENIKNFATENKLWYAYILFKDPEMIFTLLIDYLSKYWIEGVRKTDQNINLSRDFVNDVINFYLK